MKTNDLDLKIWLATAVQTIQATPCPRIKWRASCITFSSKQFEVMLMALARNLLFGALAGAAATYIMTQFQNRAQPLMEKVKSQSQKGPEVEQEEQKEEQEPATTRVAEKLYARVRHSELPDEKKDQAGQWVHYGFGTMMGLGFGALASVLPKNPIVRGLLYGSLVWFFADEIGNAAAKLSPPPWKVDGATHAYAWLSHLVYGAALSGVYATKERFAA